VRLEGLGQLKKRNDLIGNRTRLWRVSKWKFHLGKLQLQVGTADSSNIKFSILVKM
jgi:hypothetical protein